MEESRSDTLMFLKISCLSIEQDRVHTLLAHFIIYSDDVFCDKLYFLHQGVQLWMSDLTTGW